MAAWKTAAEGAAVLLFLMVSWLFILFHVVHIYIDPATWWS